MDIAINHLKLALNAISPIDEDIWNSISAICEVKVIDKGGYFLRAGEIANSICFVINGLMREYYIDVNGKEATRGFCKAGDFTGSLSDLLSWGAANTSIQALEKCDIIVIPWDTFNALSETNASLMRLKLKVTEALYVRKSIREYEMLSLTALERYANFVRDEIDLVSKLPRHMIASYLGISQVHLSRICAREKPKKLQKAKT